MNAFAQHRPVRIRVDTEVPAGNVDAIAPAYVVVYPDPCGDGSIAASALWQTPAQLAELTAAVIRFATRAGVMQLALASLVSSPSKMSIEQHPPAPDTPKDDLPPHLRG